MYTKGKILCHSKAKKDIKQRSNVSNGSIVVPFIPLKKAVVGVEMRQRREKKQQNNILYERRASCNSFRINYTEKLNEQGIM